MRLSCTLNNWGSVCKHFISLLVVLFTAPIAIALCSVVLSGAKIGNRKFELVLRWLLMALWVIRQYGGCKARNIYSNQNL
jgi:hypothetical protein